MKRFYAITTAFLALLAPAGTSASPPPILCGNIPGCNSAPGNVIFTTGIPLIAQIFLNAAAALSLLFVIIGGARLLISFGNDDAFNKAKQTILWALAGLVTAISAHRIVIAVTSQAYVAGGDPVIGLISSIIGMVVSLLNALFLIAVLIGGFRLLMARGKEDEVSKGRTMVIYAILGAVIINLAPFVVKQMVAL